MTGAMWATLIPAIVALLGALAALIRVEAVNKTANNAQVTAAATNYRLTAHSSNTLAHPVSTNLEGTRTVPTDETPSVGNAPYTPLDGAALMGVRTPVTDPVPAEDAPVAAQSEPVAAETPAPVDTKQRVLDALESLSAAVKML
jgi:hypothetical protein